MKKQISRRHFLGTVGVFSTLACASPLLAGAPDTSLRPIARGENFLRRVQKSAEDLIVDARLDGAVGFSVANQKTGAILEEVDGGRGLPPASVAKALTAAYALETLGPGHHFETRVLVTGGVQNGVVQGDVILAGGGDPTLDTDSLSRLAKSMKSAGITQVKGGLKVWGAALPYVYEIDTQQPDHVGYNPSLSGLNLNYNRVHFEWRRASGKYSVTMQARTETHRPDVKMARMVVEPRSLPVYTYADNNGRDNWTVARAALGDGGARWLPVRKPQLYAGEVFQTFAAAHGIRLSAPKVINSLPKGEVVATHKSAALRIILRDMLKWSTNLTAEAVGMTATTVRLGKAPSNLKASANAMNDWARDTLGLGDVALVDHSGLGDQSRISARDMMKALRAIRLKMGIKPLLKGFPMRDEKRRVIKNHPLNVQAKTGTLNFVSGLAGFVDLPDGTELVFAIFAGDLDRRAGLSVAERERPEGGRGWNRRAKVLQQALIERWGVMYGS